MYYLNTIGIIPMPFILAAAYTFIRSHNYNPVTYVRVLIYNLCLLVLYDS
nr:MAG TPA: hypothetical protein [Caudoviricetes sp.]